jgi:hypothetical protein
LGRDQWEVSAAPSIGILHGYSQMGEAKGEARADVENGEENPVEENDGEAKVGSRPPWDEEGRAFEGDNLTPVKCYDTHSETMSNTEQLVDLDVVRGDPADPGKGGECCEEVRWQEVYEDTSYQKGQISKAGK